MKIVITHKPSAAGDGSILFWFRFARQCRMMLIYPTDRGWCVFGAGRENHHFLTFDQADKFALTAAVLIAHRRPIPQ